MVPFEFVFVAELGAGGDGIELGRVLLNGAEFVRGLAHLDEFRNGGLFVVYCTEVRLECCLEGWKVCPGHRSASGDFDNVWTCPCCGSFRQLVEDRDPADLHSNALG